MGVVEQQAARTAGNVAGGSPPASVGTEEPLLAASAPPSPTAEWTPQRLGLHLWLESNAPALAPVYSAVVRMSSDRTFPGRVWFMAHALRDMRNRLPAALAGPSDGSRTEYSLLAGGVTKRWIQDGLPADGSCPLEATAEPSSSGPVRYEISQALLEAVSELVAGDLAIAPRKRDNAHRLFEAVAGGPVPNYVILAWLDATNRAERFAHLRDAPLTEEDEQEFDEVLARCERALVAMANRSYENMDELDEILGSANN